MEYVPMWKESADQNSTKFIAGLLHCINETLDGGTITM